MDNIYPINQGITKRQIDELCIQKGLILWLTGLSGSGKSTIAKEVQRKLFESGKMSYILDGDNLRLGLNKDLGFSFEDRKENLRRASEVACILRENNIIVISCFITPFASLRKLIADLCGDGFHLVYVEASLGTCEKRDPKGLYKKARDGVIKDFTGIGQDYEIPEKSSLHLNSNINSIDTLSGQVIQFLSKLEDNDHS